MSTSRQNQSLLANYSSFFLRTPRILEELCGSRLGFYACFTVFLRLFYCVQLLIESNFILILYTFYIGWLYDCNFEFIVEFVRNKTRFTADTQHELGKQLAAEQCG